MRQTCAGSASRRASGRVGRVILRMIPSRRVHAGLCKLFSTPQDLLRRAADLIDSRMPPGRIDWVVGGRVVFCPKASALGRCFLSHHLSNHSVLSHSLSNHSFSLNFFSVSFPPPPLLKQTRRRLGPFPPSKPPKNGSFRLQTVGRRLF